MGTVVTFPDSRPVARDGIDPQTGSAIVIILPVVRIERYDDGSTRNVDEPPNPSPGRKRRRRSSRT
jgi:hypothetical protein